MRNNYGSHYSNDDKRLYEFQRRADPPWYSEGVNPDRIAFWVCVGILVLIVLILLLGKYL